MEPSSHPSTSKTQPLVTDTTPAISSVVNPKSPNILGYPHNAGSNMGGQTLVITGTNFSGGTSTSIPVRFTPTISTTSPVISCSGVLQSDNATIHVSSPHTAPCSSVETYVINVCINDVWTTHTKTNSSASQQFQALATLTYGTDGTWSPDQIWADDRGTVTFVDSTGAQINVDFTLPDGTSTTVIGDETETGLFSGSLPLTVDDPGSTPVTVLATVVSGGAGQVGSNATINVGTGNSDCICNE